MDAGVLSEREKIFENDLIPTVNEGAGPGSIQESDASPRRTSPFKIRMPPSVLHDPNGMFSHGLTDMDLAGRFHGTDKIQRGAYGIVADEIELRTGDRIGPLLFQSKLQVAAHDFIFFQRLGISKPVAEHETV